jgi:hypothetical protein
MERDNIRMFIYYRIPVFIYAVLIFFLSVLPVGNAPPGPDPLPEPGEPGAEPADSPAYSQPARSILWLKYNIPFFDIIANIGLYFIFGLLLYRMWKVYIPVVSSTTEDEVKRDLKVRLGIISMVTGLAFLWSVFNEFSQNALASRIMDAYDVLYNTIGAAFGALVFFIKDMRMK